VSDETDSRLDTALQDSPSKSAVLVHAERILDPRDVDDSERLVELVAVDI